MITYFSTSIASNIIILYDSKLLVRIINLRFYDHDGCELDVSDPAFYMDMEDYQEIEKSINNMLSNYDTTLCLAKYAKKTFL